MRELPDHPRNCRGFIQPDACRAMASIGRSLAGCLAPCVATLATLCAGSAAADLVETIARVKPSIVAVGLYRQTDNPQFSLRGTGFAVGDGSLIATNAHVIADQGNPANPAGAPALVVQARIDGRTRLLAARLVASDPAHDLAILRLTDQKLPALKIRAADSVREGMAVAFSGFPIGGALGFAPVTHRGIVASITPIALPSPTAQQLNPKLVRQLKVGSFDIFQLDATAYPGNSGSPLFDVDTGEVIGVISMVLIKGTKESALSQPSGITYAVPSNFLQELMLISR